ncbi:hypothetical protein ASL14_09855 [Paenibacillus sp. IHB B 3084]|nr:hypothetical protein ASL14_09855 [Paenibacillus sp. IHB B 3084]
MQTERRLGDSDLFRSFRKMQFLAYGYEVLKLAYLRLLSLLSRIPRMIALKGQKKRKIGSIRFALLLQVIALF